MKKKHKLYLRINLVSLFFIIVSFISVTLAWFAYSGMSNLSTEIDVKAWYITLENNGEEVSNEVVISLTDVYPGMETLNEIIKINNLGDSDATVKYSIVSSRILGNPEDNYIIDETIKSEYVEDLLAHEYPFHLNINLSKNYVLSKGEETEFEVSISWPLDSDHDSLDSLWGSEAYKYQLSEINKKKDNEDYNIKPAIQIVIKITAEQYLKEDDSSDTKYNLGDEILFDVVNNQVCTEINETCLSTYVIDVDNKMGDDKVTLLPNPKKTYLNTTFNNYQSDYELITNDWITDTRPLVVNDILKIISKDIENSMLIRNELSDAIIGNLNYNDRIEDIKNKTINYNGYYQFKNLKFDYLISDSCYLTNSEYALDTAFIIKKTDENHSIVYGENKTISCNLIPVIIANKSNL
ncbi:MAG: hypothetical protein PHX03_02260 [Bacilli bacterium]|nr:hypothetical protein [Bacilli bacterium]